MRRCLAAPHRFTADGNADRKPFLSLLCAIFLRSTFFEHLEITLNLMTFYGLFWLKTEMTFYGLFWLKTETIYDAVGKEEKWLEIKTNIRSGCTPKHGRR